MASNVGSFRDAISVYYKEGSITSDMGSEVLTYTKFDLFADVNQLSGKQALYYGLDVLNESYKVICRAPSLKRPIKVLYSTETFRVFDSFIDKRGVYLTMFITKSQEAESIES